MKLERTETKVIWVGDRGNSITIKEVVYLHYGNNISAHQFSKSNHINEIIDDETLSLLFMEYLEVRLFIIPLITKERPDEIIGFIQVTLDDKGGIEKETVPNTIYISDK